MGEERFRERVTLAGERVEVRPFSVDDAADYIEAVRAGEDWLPSSFPTDLEAETLAWWLTKGVHNMHRFGVGVHFAVVARETGRLAGTIGLFRVDWKQLTCEVGYGMRPAARGRGYAPEALGLVSRWALADCGLHRVELRALTTNAASIRVAEKTGFQREGVARGAERVDGRNRDQYVFGLVAPDLDSVAVGGSGAVRPAASSGSTPMSHDSTAPDSIAAAIAAAGEHTLVLHTGDLAGAAARRMLPKLPGVCFTDPGDRAADAVRAAAAHQLAQLIMVGTIEALADGVALDEITTDMGGEPGQAAAVAAAASPARVYELWEDAGLLGQCGRELCRRVALRLEETAGGAVAAQVVLVDATGARMVGMYGRMARTG